MVIITTPEQTKLVGGFVGPILYHKFHTVSENDWGRHHASCRDLVSHEVATHHAQNGNPPHLCHAKLQIGVDLLIPVKKNKRQKDSKGNLLFQSTTNWHLRWSDFISSVLAVINNQFCQCKKCLANWPSFTKTRYKTLPAKISPWDVRSARPSRSGRGWCNGKTPDVGSNRRVEGIPVLNKHHIWLARKKCLMPIPRIICPDMNIYIYTYEYVLDSTKVSASGIQKARLSHQVKHLKKLKIVLEIS